MTTKIDTQMTGQEMVALSKQHSLYEWSHEGVAQTDPVIAAKEAYLNPPVFLSRQVSYFAIWNLKSD